MQSLKKEESPNQLSLLEDSPVKTYQSQADKKESLVKDLVFGPSLQDSSKMYNRSGQLLKMYLPYDLKDLPWSYKISTRSGIMQSGIAYPVVQLVGYTEEIAYGSLPNPSRVPTPSVSDVVGGDQSERVEISANGGYRLRKKNKPEMHYGAKLSDAMLFDHKRKWPTPSTRDWKGGYLGGRIRNGKVSMDTLDVAVQYTDNKEKKKVALNPEWVEWLMGYPKDYTLPEEDKA